MSSASCRSSERLEGHERDTLELSRYSQNFKPMATSPPQISISDGGKLRRRFVVDQAAIIGMITSVAFFAGLFYLAYKIFN